MAARAIRHATFVPIAVCVLATLVAPIIPAAAASSDLLARPVLDLAFVTRADGAPPDVLTLDTNDVVNGNAHLSLLHRDDADWSEVVGETITLDEASINTEQPWLVDLGGGRFAALARVADPTASVRVLPFTVDPSKGRAAISVGEPMPVTGNLISAGVADIDGDGANDLVVMSWTDGDENGRCVETTLRVLRSVASGLADTDHVVKVGGGAARVTGAAFGEFDGRPGEDMLAHAYESCGPSPDVPDRHHLVALRLADGSIIHDLPSSAEDSERIQPNAPSIVDIDGDGHDEAVVRGGSDLAIIDPSDGWRRLALAVGDIRPLAVRSGSPATGKAVVAWLAPIEGPEPRIWSARIGRVGGSLAAATATPVDFPGLPDTVREDALMRMQFDGGFTGPASVSRIDLDRDGCPELIMPVVIVDCLGTGSIHRGPAWLNATPLSVVGPPSAPSLLVAEGQDWYPSSGGLYPPTPGAATSGAWRDGYSPAFTLDEVALPLDAADAPVAAPVVGALTDVDGSVDLRGPGATRMLMRVMPVLPGSEPFAREMSTEEFLRTDPIDNEYFFSRRMPAGIGAASATVTLPFAIANEAMAAYGNADHWAVSAAVLDARGDVSEVTNTIVVWDQDAPDLTLAQAPFLSLPWPLEARISGTAEAGATVRLGDAPPVTVGASGAFELPTRLAPWPQTLTVTAADASGNTTPATVSIMGGVDVRVMPWPAIAAVAIIIAVALSSLRGTRRVRSVPAMAAASEDGDDLVIEELDPGSTFRRD